VPLTVPDSCGRGAATCLLLTGKGANWQFVGRIRNSIRLALSHRSSSPLPLGFAFGTPTFRLASVLLFVPEGEIPAEAIGSFRIIPAVFGIAEFARSKQDLVPAHQFHEAVDIRVIFQRQVTTWRIIARRWNGGGSEEDSLVSVWLRSQIDVAVTSLQYGVTL